MRKVTGLLLALVSFAAAFGPCSLTWNNINDESQPKVVHVDVDFVDLLDCHNEDHDTLVNVLTAIGGSTGTTGLSSTGDIKVNIDRDSNTTGSRFWVANHTADTLLRVADDSSAKVFGSLTVSKRTTLTDSLIGVAARMTGNISVTGKIVGADSLRIAGATEIGSNSFWSGSGQGLWFNSPGTFTYGMYKTGTSLAFRSGSTSPFLTVDGSSLPTFNALITAGAGLTLSSSQVADFSSGKVTLPANSSSETTLGRARLDVTKKTIAVYDGVREQMSSLGWAPLAFPPGYSITGTYSTATNLPANGGAITVPITVPSKMIAQALYLSLTDASLARSYEFALYVQYQQNDQTSEATLTQVSGATCSASYTASGAGNGSCKFGSAVYLAPGTYWAVVRNTHASNTLGIGTSTLGTQNLFYDQTKTIGSSLSSTLDFKTGWTQNNEVPGIYLRGRVFGDAFPGAYY